MVVVEVRALGVGDAGHVLEVQRHGARARRDVAAVALVLLAAGGAAVQVRQDGLDALAQDVGGVDGAQEARRAGVVKVEDVETQFDFGAGVGQRQLLAAAFLFFVTTGGRGLRRLARPVGPGREGRGFWTSWHGGGRSRDRRRGGRQEDGGRVVWDGRGPVGDTGHGRRH